MHMVVHQVVLAGGDEYLRAGDAVAAVTIRDGLRAQKSEIGAGMSFGQTHCALPRAADEFRQVDFLLLGRAERGEREDGALRQPRI